MAARVRWRGTTTQRGYGWTHRQERDRRLAIYRPGDICAHCGRPIWAVRIITPAGRSISTVDLPHNADRTGYLPGLAHRRCNRADGAVRGNQARGTAKGWAQSRIW